MKRIAVLGSTGSIGRQTLDVVRRLPDRLTVTALAAGSNAEALAHQALEFGALAASLVDEHGRHTLDAMLPRQTERTYGSDSLERIATRDDVDIVVVAVAGAIGTRATIAALCAGKDVALATKEVLVAAGEIVVSAAMMGEGRLLPIDSEHSGLLQCLEGRDPATVEKLWITASGGPLRTWTLDQMKSVTVADALNHPTWSMGNKITIDSATMMNKGLEMIEAHWLFGVAPEKIDCVVHPQSIVHAMVEFVDGSIVAQLGLPDMRLPIEYALLYPERVPAGLPRLSPTQIGTLTFEPPDEERFECLALARRAMTCGGTAPAVLNAANEVAVERFLGGTLSFLQIAAAIKGAMDAHESTPSPSLDQVLAADSWAREYVYRLKV
ncbi:MAG: 1-deoxy-D-xylulose-5-phosphate reductoisomerase [Capsulimonadaceae bacterium]|nr:1-deoxy-D-xylulose-5-phosphate reductoisomerase [Capsulimonadaceae bacterium]